MKIRRTKYDDIFSKVIRERDDYTCQRCGKQGRVECSHFFSRRHMSTRWEPLNACAHCFTCHQYLGENPIIFAAWVKEYLGEGAYEILDEKHKEIKKWLKVEKDEMHAHYKAELARLQEIRSEGTEGVLHLVAYQ